MQEEMNDTNEILGADSGQEQPGNLARETETFMDTGLVNESQVHHKSATLIRLTFVVALLALAGVIFLFATKSGNTKPVAKAVFATSDEGRGFGSSRHQNRFCTGRFHPEQLPDDHPFSRQYRAKIQVNGRGSDVQKEGFGKEGWQLLP
jgi:hypothetical protein